MTEQDINKIKALFPEGEVKCTLTENGIVIERSVLNDEYGAPLFKGDKYWWARGIDFDVYKAFTIYTNKDCIIENGIEMLVENDSCKIFASKESAERWIKENKPSKPLYVDPDNGDEFYKGDEVFYYSFGNNKYIIHKYLTENTLSDMESTKNTSKVYPTREKCELALAEFIAGKHGKIVVDRGRVYFDTAINDDMQCSFEGMVK